MNLTTGTVSSNTELDRLVHGPADLDEIATVEALVREDLQVQEALRKVNITDLSLVVIEPWIYGQSKSTPLAMGGKHMYSLVS